MGRPAQPEPEAQHDPDAAAFRSALELAFSAAVAERSGSSEVPVRQLERAVAVATAEETGAEVPPTARESIGELVELIRDLVAAEVARQLPAAVERHIEELQAAAGVKRRGQRPLTAASAIAAAVQGSGRRRSSQ